MNVKQSVAHSKHLINIMSPLIHLYSHLVPGYKFLIDEQHSKKRSMFEDTPPAYLEAAGKGWGFGCGVSRALWSLPQVNHHLDSPVICRLERHHVRARPCEDACTNIFLMESAWDKFATHGPLRKQNFGVERRGSFSGSTLWCLNCDPDRKNVVSGHRCNSWV